jgi:hypothetical protein
MSTIADLPEAVLDGHRNEVSLDQKADSSGGPSFDDPVKFRMGARPVNRPGYYLGAISGDLLSGGRRLEKVFIAFKVDPEPCVEIYCQQDANSTEDSTMVKVARFSARGNELGGAGGNHHLQSPNGRYHAVLQDDGNFVVYDSQPGFWQALWSWITGRL